MHIPKRFFAAKFTANARSIAALIATCLAAYGLTMLSWLETSQQRDVQLNPREEAPDFLVTNARYLDFQPASSDAANSAAQEGHREGLLRLDIQSKTLSHYASTKKTVFEAPVAQFSDQDNQAWLMTSDTAISIPLHHESGSDINTTSTESIQLQGNVQLTALSHSDIAMEAENITIDTAREIFSATSQIKMDFEGGSLLAGGFKSALKSGNVRFNNGVKATYFLQRSTPE